VLPTHVHQPAVDGIFPSPARFESHTADLALDKALLPTAKRILSWLLHLRRFQQGQAQQYLLYILITVMALLAWNMPFRAIFIRLFAR